MTANFIILQLINIIRIVNLSVDLFRRSSIHSLPLANVFNVVEQVCIALSGVQWE